MPIPTAIPEGQSKWIKFSNLPANTTKEDIMTHLVWYAPTLIQQNPNLYIRVTDLSQPKARKQGKHKYSAFVEFDDETMAKSIKQKIDNTKLKDIPLTLSIQRDWNILNAGNRRNKLRNLTKAVTLHSIHYKMTDDQIRSLCSSYGTIRDMNWNHVADRNPHRNVVVHMSTFEEAANLYDAVHGKVFHNVPLQTSFIKLLCPSEREERKQEQIKEKEQRMKMKQERLEQMESEQRKQKRERERIKYEKRREKQEAARQKQENDRICLQRKAFGLLEQLQDSDWDRYFQAANQKQQEMKDKLEGERKELELKEAKREEERKKREEKQKLEAEAKRIRKQIENKENEEKQKKEKEKLTQMREVLVNVKCKLCTGIGHLGIDCPAPQGGDGRFKKYVPLTLADLDNPDVVKATWWSFIRNVKLRKKGKRTQRHELNHKRLTMLKIDRLKMGSHKRQEKVVETPRTAGVTSKTGLAGASCNVRKSYGIKFA